MSEKVHYKTGDWVVYPTHGVGKVVGVEEQEIEGFKLRLVVISFEKDRMTLRVPITKATNAGLRKLSSRDEMKTDRKSDVKGKRVSGRVDLGGHGSLKKKN